jgi:hypothetical protein
VRRGGNDFAQKKGWTTSEIEHTSTLKCINVATPTEFPGSNVESSLCSVRFVTCEFLVTKLCGTACYLCQKRYKKFFLRLITSAPCQNDIWESEGIASLFLTSLQYGGESTSRPSRFIPRSNR